MTIKDTVIYMSLSLSDQYCPVLSFTEPMYHMIVEEYGIFMGYVGYMGGTQPGQYCTDRQWPGLESENINIEKSGC